MSQTIERKASLVASKCPNCGKYNCFQGKVGQEVTCMDCGIKYNPKPMIKARYICPNCGRSGYLMAEDDLVMIKCSSCRSPIDVVYHPSKNELASMNYWKLRKNKK